MDNPRPTDPNDLMRAVALRRAARVAPRGVTLNSADLTRIGRS